MTGLGLAQGPTQLGDLTVELRSVNGRNLAVKMRLSSECQGLEAATERYLRSRFRRGSLLVLISVTNPARDLDALVDEDLARQVAKRLEQLGEQLGLDQGPELRDVLGFPGVISGNQASRARTSWEPPDDVVALMEAAADQLQQSREEEGAATVADMLGLLAEIRAQLAEVEKRAPAVVAGYREKLLRRVNEFLAGQARTMEDGEVVREVALFADRIDIQEELQRLGTHVSKAEAMLAAGGPVGRNLGFLLQEILREVNTVGSKAPDADSTSWSSRSDRSRSRA